jgi:uncharacterized protein YjdB
MRPGSIALAVALLASGCDGGDVIQPPPPPPPSPIASVQVVLDKPALHVGEATVATATLRDREGAVLTDRTVTWASSNPAVASVAHSGQVVAVGAGTTQITATSDSRTGIATLVVTPAVVHSVVLAAHAVALTPRYPVLVDVVLRDVHGNLIMDRSIAWSSSHPEVASVDAGGLVVGVAEGSTTITASTDGASGTLAITVMPPDVASVAEEQRYVTITVGQVDTLRAVARDARGNNLPDQVPAWVSTDLPPHPATVTSEGIVTGITPGVEYIAPHRGGHSGVVAVTVSTVPVASVTANPATVSVRVGEVVSVAAQPRDIDGNALPERTVRWSSTDSSAAAGWSSGPTLLVTGLKVGTTTWKASVAGHVVEVPVTVTALAVANLCEQIAGATVLGTNLIGGAWPSRIFLGRLTNRNDPWSAINPTGVFGSPEGALSTNNPWGIVGRFNSSYSARSPSVSVPPILMKDGVAIATYSLRPGVSPNVSPDFAASCEFP